MKERIEEIFAKMDEFRNEATAHATKGNKLAGRRARMASLEIAMRAQGISLGKR